MPDTTEARSSSRWKQWAWFAGIYLASLLVFSMIVYLLRWLIVQ